LRSAKKLRSDGTFEGGDERVGIGGLAAGTALGGTGGTMLMNRVGDRLFGGKPSAKRLPQTGMSTGTKAAIGAGVAGLGAAGLGAYLYSRGRKKKKR